LYQVFELNYVIFQHFDYTVDELNAIQ